MDDELILQLLNEKFKGVGKIEKTNLESELLQVKDNQDVVHDILDKLFPDGKMVIYYLL
jgi:hypothetical protein